MRTIMDYRLTGIRKSDGLRFDCSLRVTDIGEAEAGRRLYRMECPALLITPKEIDEVNEKGACACVCMMIQVLLDRFGILLEDEQGRPFTLPSPQSFDPDFPTKEEREESAKAHGYFRDLFSGSLRKASEGEDGEGG